MNMKAFRFIDLKHFGDMPERGLKALLIFVGGLLAVPAWIFLGGFWTRAGAHSLGEGVSGWYSTLSFPIFFLSLAACLAAPILYPQRLERKITFAALAIVIVGADFLLSQMLVRAVFGFAD
jgi:hypothetical protein